MTEHYVTLFDSNFIPQGLALHHSFVNHGGKFVLWIICLDDLCFTILNELELDHVKLLDISRLETAELLAVKPTRRPAEYCWTLTPWSIQWILELEPTADRVTYVDADVYLLKSPQPIFDELERYNKSVLVTEHGYAPEFDQSPTSGRFCVQFLTIVRHKGVTPLKWWRDQCLDWCYSRFEDGKFGDQKYIETMAAIFEDHVHVAIHNKWFQGPWNASVFPFSSAILYHFHQLRIGSDGIVMWPSNYTIPSPTEKFVYHPYCELLIKLSLQVIGAIPSQKPLFEFPPEVTGFRRVIRNLKKLLRIVLDQTPQYEKPKNILTF